MKSFWSWFLSLKLGSFLRQILIVLVSVSISLAVGRWIDAEKRESNIEVSLSLVCSELISNLENLKENYEVTQEAYRACTMLNRHLDSISSVPTDTLETWIVQVLPYVGTSAPSRYALDIIKNSATYDEFSNALLIYLCRIYDQCSVYTRECEQIFSETMATAEQINEMGASQVAKEDTTIYGGFRLCMAVPQFRNRVHLTTNFAVEMGQRTIADVQEVIVLLNRLIKTDGYKTFQFDPTADHIGAL